MSGFAAEGRSLGSGPNVEFLMRGLKLTRNLGNVGGGLRLNGNSDVNAQSAAIRRKQCNLKSRHQLNTCSTSQENRSDLLKYMYQALFIILY